MNFNQEEGFGFAEVLVAIVGICGFVLLGSESKEDNMKLIRDTGNDWVIDELRRNLILTSIYLTESPTVRTCLISRL